MNALNLSTLDIFAFLAILTITLIAIIWGNRRKTAGESENFLDYLIMGRQLTLPLFVATLVATWYGGIFGVTRIAFERGIYNFVTQGVFWYAVYIAFALLLIRKVRSFKAVTLPELVGKMYGPKSRKLAAVFNLFNVIPIAYTISLGLLVKEVFGLPPLPSMLLGVGFVVCYSLFGGFRSVVFSDLVQFFAMCFGVLIVAILSFTTYGGIDFLRSNLPESHFSLTGGESVGTTLVWGFIAISTLVDPNFYQRCFAAKSEAVARKGILISTVIWLIFDICTTMGGMYARAVMPDASPDTSYLHYSLQLLPPGLKGLFLGGLVATILSTIDSYLFVAGTTVTYDLLKSKSQEILKTRISIIVIASFSVFFALLFDGNIKLVWKTLGTYSTACLLFPVLCGYISNRRISDKQFLATSLASVITTTLWRNIKLTGFWSNVDDLYVGLVTSALCIAVFGLFNLRKRVRLGR